MASAPPTSKKNRVVKRYCFAIVLWSSDQMYFQKKLNSEWCACDACASPGTVRANVSAITISYNYLLCTAGLPEEALAAAATFSLYHLSNSAREATSLCAFIL